MHHLNRNIQSLAYIAAPLGKPLFHKNNNKELSRQMMLTADTPCLPCRKLWSTSWRKSFWFAVFMLFTSPANSAERSIAFYYHQIDSVRELLSYDRVVVTPEALSAVQLSQLKQAQVEVYAYLSVGEANPLLAKRLPTARLAENSAWQSVVMDLQHPAWQQHLLQSAQQLTARGFDGLFLDTLDSYQLVDSKLHNAQREALRQLIDQLATSSASLILNRGFELLPQLSQAPAAVVAESLYFGYDVSNNHYFKQSAADSDWLVQQLQQVQARGIEAIVLDYLPDNLQQRLEAAKYILQQGFTPYIADGLLRQTGVSLHYPVRRRVLGLYDGNNSPKKQSRCHRYLSMLVEYAGYVPDCVNFRLLDPQQFSAHPYAAAVLDLPDANYQEPRVIALIQQILPQLPTVFIGSLPTEPTVLSYLGLRIDGYYDGQLKANIDTLYPLPTAGTNRFPRVVSTRSEVETLVTLTDSQAAIGAAVIKAPWGGALLAPMHLQELVGDRLRWMLDPFAYLLPLLQLPEIPVPDITTESGLRILTAHIDGDGFPSVAWLPGKPFAGEAIYQKILRKYPLPHTVSVVEAEVAPHGLYPQHSAELEEIARNIFRLPHVELASHTFSHPFFWDPRISAREKLYGDALPVPGYSLDYDREVAGSVAYINQRLAPPDKAVKVFLWSGMANPTPDIIARTTALGLQNVNGGNTYVLNDNFSYAQVSPHINWYKDAVQVYAPIMNENLYTELWTENFSGFSRATETFVQLGAPRRLKPVSIYYHMYSGMYPSSIGALDYLYQWAQRQDFIPLYLSEYAERAQGLYETGIAHHLLQPGFRIRSSSIRSLRLPTPWYLAATSSGVAGVNTGPDGWYATLSDPVAEIVPTTAPPHLPNRPYLQQANAILTQWQQEPDRLTVTLLSHVPLQATLLQTSGCKVVRKSENLQIQRFDSWWQLSSAQAGNIELQLSCVQQGREQQ